QCPSPKGAAAMVLASSAGDRTITVVVRMSWVARTARPRWPARRRTARCRARRCCWPDASTHLRTLSALCCAKVGRRDPLPTIVIDAGEQVDERHRRLPHGGHDYELTSNDVVFGVFVGREGVADQDRDAARREFFSRGRPCLRTSPLA